jgi:hypothetical protein
MMYLQTLLCTNKQIIRNTNPRDKVCYQHEVTKTRSYTAKHERITVTPWTLFGILELDWGRNIMKPFFDEQKAKFQLWIAQQSKHITLQ